jgi:3-phosphoshikimate 1-carboxyvinyltransferase
MAMSFAPLTLIYGSLKFDDAEVVSKSYPEFWEDLKKLGFTVK